MGHNTSSECRIRVMEIVVARKYYFRRLRLRSLLMEVPSEDFAYLLLACFLYSTFTSLGLKGGLVDLFLAPSLWVFAREASTVPPLECSRSHQTGGVLKTNYPARVSRAGGFTPCRVSPPTDDQGKPTWIMFNHLPPWYYCIHGCGIC
ncbi:hypothetical protein I7I50_11060 [Histoplasma capsulatum G186AR]|uniref:Uncharacterized protein n=1 Tax=Ajellomyces capsulatus TaxID=5037 RepID=A0A8H7Z541_AJECA|nr:hypothetical protein I7I52_02299 [Histoplasma capsulatum]QSS69685.1 hypothetical protein I7I50_11060 [Histoplasma capsulatum G186AR]